MFIKREFLHRKLTIRVPFFVHVYVEKEIAHTYSAARLPVQHGFSGLCPDFTLEWNLRLNLLHSSRCILVRPATVLCSLNACAYNNVCLFILIFGMLYMHAQVSILRLSLDLLSQLGFGILMRIIWTNKANLWPSDLYQKKIWFLCDCCSLLGS